MNDRGALLLMSKDSTLLDTRSRVLEQAGFRVIRSTNLEDMKKELTKCRIAILLLCHTLSADESLQANMAASAADPHTITVCLVTICDPCVVSGNIVVHRMCGPQRLVEMVRDLLR